MSLPCVLIKKSTGEILKHAMYPRPDMQPVIGLDSDLEWLIKYEPSPVPVYDTRIFKLNKIESITTTPHPVYTWLNQYQITYSTTKLPTSDIEVNIIQAEVQANETLLPNTQQLKLIALSVGILFKNLNNNLLTTKEQAIKDKMISVATRIWNNDTELKAKLTELSTGLEPNIDAGWEKET